MSGTDSAVTGDEDPNALYTAIQSAVGQVLVGNEVAIEHLTVALLTRGHVLLEGPPGVAKTTIARLFARASDLEYSRIQMTPDVLPSDVTGTSIYHEHLGTFELQHGPVFANLVVADEINRATPKTQSALLEAMGERQVTIDDETHSLPEPFMVVATQNPIEMEGVYDLPEAQRDRFQLKLTIDLPDRTDERTLFDRFHRTPDLDPGEVDPVVTGQQLRSAREVVGETRIAEPVREYTIDLVRATRTHPDVTHGASPRGTLAFVGTTKARAAIHGRGYVIPDDVKTLAHPVLDHRLVLNTDAELSGVTASEIVDDVLESVDPPSGETDANGRPPEERADAPLE